jgi:DnaK suppressor protein
MRAKMSINPHNEQLHKKITEEITALNSEKQQYMSSLRETASSQSDEGDQSVTLQDRESITLSLNHTSKKIITLQNVIKKIEGGDYGLCDGCGFDIPKLRLAAEMTATLCTPCKQNEEHIAKRYAS